MMWGRDRKAPRRQGGRALASGRALLSLAASLALLMPASAGARAQTSADELREEFHQTYPLAPGGRLSLDNINGAVRITGWDRNEVRVDAVKRAYTQERLQEAEIKVEANGDAVRIKTKYPSRSYSWTDDEKGRLNNPASVEYTLSVPRGARLDSITTINGALGLEGLTGDAIASSINGPLTARALTGEVKLSVINGRLEATFGGLDESKPISLNSVNGPLVIVIPSDSQAELRASTVHGGISNEFQLPVRRGDYVGRELAGRLGRGGTRIRLSNVNGSITIRHAADGRTLSPAVNLLSETSDNEEREAAREAEEARRSVREAQREVAQAQREAERAQREAQREAQRAQQEAQRAQLEAQNASRESQLEAQQAAREAAREAERARLEAQRVQQEAQREVQRAQLEAQKAQQEAQRAAQQAQREAQLEAQQAQREAQEAAREAQREGQEAAREAQREAQEAVREAQREALEAQREAQRALAEAQREVARGSVVISREDGRQIERESNTFTTTGVPRILVKNFDGPITVRGWDKPEVTYTAVKRAMDEKEMKGIKISSRASNTRNTQQRDDGTATTTGSSEVTITAEFDKAFAHELVMRDNRVVSFSSGAGVELELNVPRNAVLSISSADGRLRVEGVRGELELNTGDGAVDVSGGGGRLRVETGDGRIRVTDFDGEADATTGDGRISLEGRFTRLGARTGDGTISLAIPSDSNVTIETDAESVVSDGWAVAEDGNNTERRVRRWKVGRGGEVFRLRTGEGQIVLRQR